MTLPAVILVDVSRCRMIKTSGPDTLLTAPRTTRPAALFAHHHVRRLARAGILHQPRSVRRCLDVYYSVRRDLFRRSRSNSVCLDGRTASAAGESADAQSPIDNSDDAARAQARSAIGSVALGVNWSSNFIIGLCFLPLRDWLAGGRDDRQGSVFYIFAVVSAIGALIMLRRLPG